MRQTPFANTVNSRLMDTETLRTILETVHSLIADVMVRGSVGQKMGPALTHK